MGDEYEDNEVDMNTPEGIASNSKLEQLWAYKWLCRIAWRKLSDEQQTLAAELTAQLNAVASGATKAKAMEDFGDQNLDWDAYLPKLKQFALDCRLGPMPEDPADLKQAFNLVGSLIDKDGLVSPEEHVLFGEMMVTQDLLVKINDLHKAVCGDDKIEHEIKRCLEEGPTLSSLFPPNADYTAQLAEISGSCPLDSAYDTISLDPAYRLPADWTPVCSLEREIEEQREREREMDEATRQEMEEYKERREAMTEAERARADEESDAYAARLLQSPLLGEDALSPEAAELLVAKDREEA